VVIDNAKAVRWLRDGAQPTETVARLLTQSGAIGRTLAEHRAILDALAAHDPGVARSWSIVHIAAVETWLAAAL